ncbi:HAMP domain-containing histidine kinase [Corynebacterium zhongnanshanii]|uniref:histidine kinase n=1 Tax=Corynebacterium zhongnanshanii TaxID=2768834 RepID=A0ABQ6VFG5_9CORY|nr:HAMP domain-containing sensor histidine kinase [Corynebacterium zhongnanshanii]KAB3523043.1 HAMP domain-containing histidine kinase [Corynebacterium zhongnanshanii]
MILRRLSDSPDDRGVFSEDDRPSLFQGMSLRGRLTALTAIVVIASIAIITVAAYTSVSTVMYQSQDRSLQTQAHALAEDDSPGSLVRRAEDTAGVFTPSFDEEVNNFKVMVVPGTVTASGIEPSTFHDLVGPGAISVLQGDKPFSFEDFEGERMYALRQGTGTVIVVSQPTSMVKDPLDSLALVLVLLAITGAVGAIITGVVVASAGVQPINRLRRAVDRVTETGELREIPVHTHDELGALTVSYNRMMNALQSAESKQKNLVADASHELKTPLTSLRTNMELLMQLSKPGAPKLDEEEVRSLEKDVIGQIDEMSSLIGDLVDLAREDSGSAEHSSMEEVELDEIFFSVLERIQRRRPDVEFHMHLLPWCMTGDHFSLSRAFTNLMDNAAKWSPHDGVVRVWMEEVPQPLEATAKDQDCARTLEIRIADSGPGIAEADRIHVFDRFYRSIEARSQPGSGLGLAIVKQVIDKHGGMIIADESDDGGALMRVLLPAHPCDSREDPDAPGGGVNGPSCQSTVMRIEKAHRKFQRSKE